MKKNAIFLLMVVSITFLFAFSANAALRGDEGLIPLDCSKSGHNWVAVSGLGATCDSPAYFKYECSRCDATKTETSGEALGHRWVDDGTTYPDCEQPGLEKMHCSICSKTWENIISALGHNWVNKGVVMEATCEKPGIREDECENCGKTLMFEIDATGHNWRNTLIIKEATCTAEGKAKAKCRDCGKEGTRTLKKTAHTYDAWTITRQATETQKGIRTAVCQVCDKKIKEEFEFIPGDIAVYTSSGNVNIRSGAGKSNKLVDQIRKKGTYLGQLRESAIDKDGVVWHKIKYNKKICWIMSDYARLDFERVDLTKERLPDASGTELTQYFLKSLTPAGTALGLDEISADDVTEWAGEAIYLSGHFYVEHINLTGAGYSIYGVKAGDKITNAQKNLKTKGLILEKQLGDQYTYRIPCLPAALAADESGCCGSLIIIVDSAKKVSEIQLYADLPAE